MNGTVTDSPDAPLTTLIRRWREDPGATYQTWFLWEERLKNFRSIRRGLQTVVREIRDDTFGSQYRGSSLETVVHSIAEQRQIFRGADHAFLWKPKLRIPDIYESPANQRAFGHFLDTCVGCTTADELVDAVRNLDRHHIKGLGPAAANLMYFLHPTHMPPFNTAIVNGYNALTGANVKLGKWEEYLALRSGLLRLTTEHRSLLSNDLGAVAGLMFDLGSGRYSPPPQAGDPHALQLWQADLARVREETAAAANARRLARDNDRTHTEVQGWLRDLGKALGFQVWIAANDVSRPHDGGTLGDGCLTTLPPSIAGRPGADAVRLIDVLWLDSTAEVAAAFEVEHTTSIYSGIVRMLDLALGAPSQATARLFLVAPDEREQDVISQVRRPAFSRVRELDVQYLPYSALERHREAMGRFGQGLKAVEAVSRRLNDLG
ncbi:type II restriction endonuclease [Deinococcus ruber]|uniref:type II restriction endonuclease n=1 Tax=Deinococcus ruber TaxID=1848197 RepID=UPI001E5F3FC3|nr:type II restriction endonuclease [Deinococcus ruber]